MVKNFDAVGCLFCGAENTVQDQQCGTCGRPLSIETAFNERDVNGYSIIEYVARGFYGLTFKCTDLSGKPFAIKILSKESYRANGKDFMREVQTYGLIPDNPFIAQYVGMGQSEIDIEGERFAFYYIVTEWINGIPLDEWIDTTQVTPQHLYYLASDILNGLLSFEEADLWHNDLHEQNILVTQLRPSQIMSMRRDIPESFKIVDVGSAKRRTPDALKEVSDVQYLGRHLAFVVGVLKEAVESLPREERVFIKLIEPFAAKLADEDAARAFPSIVDAVTELESLRKSSRFVSPKADDTLSDPFGMINALDIYSPKMLRKMFSREFRYISDFESKDNHSIVLTGPRGCGKTMLLRHMSFDTQFDNSSSDLVAELAGVKQVGLFISARFEIGNLLVSARKPEWIYSSQHVGLLVNCIITMRLVDVLYELVDLGVVEEGTLDVLFDFVEKSFSASYLNLYNVKNHLVSITKLIQNNSDNVANYALETNSTPLYLNDLVRVLKSTVDVFSDKDIVFLIDDLSLPKIPTEILKALNPFIFNPGSYYKVRVSAHSDGLLLYDNTGEDFKENRDYIEINLGREYYQLSENYDQCLSGFDDIMRRRFSLADGYDYHGLEYILGVYEEYANFGALVREFAMEKKLGKLRYKGTHIFIKLCSGDISYSLDMLRKMYQISPEPIAITAQHNVIKNYAREQLTKLRDIRTVYIPSLYDVGHAFGELSRYKLINHGTENLRIEVDFNELSEELKEAVRELLTYGLFIDGGFSSNPDGKTTRKLLFRRIFTPVFPTTVNNSDTINLGPKTLPVFLSDPTKFRDDFIKRTQGKKATKSTEVSGSKGLMEFIDD